MIANVPKRKANGHFAKGSTAAPTRQGVATAKQLKQLCINVLNEAGLTGRPMIEEVIRTVSRDKPEALLPFIGKIIPQESEQTVTKISPIVFTNEIQPPQVESVVIEQKVITTNVPSVEEFVIDSSPTVEELPTKKRRRIKQVLKSCSIDDEEL